MQQHDAALATAGEAVHEQTRAAAGGREDSSSHPTDRHVTILDRAGGQQKLVLAHVNGLPRPQRQRHDLPHRLARDGDVAGSVGLAQKDGHAGEKAARHPFAPAEANRHLGLLPEQDVVLEVDRVVHAQVYASDRHEIAFDGNRHVAQTDDAASAGRIERTARSQRSPCQRRRRAAHRPARARRTRAGGWDGRGDHPAAELAKPRIVRERAAAVWTSHHAPSSPRRTCRASGASSAVSARSLPERGRAEGHDGLRTQVAVVRPADASASLRWPVKPNIVCIAPPVGGCGGEPSAAVGRAQLLPHQSGRQVERGDGRAQRIAQLHDQPAAVAISPRSVRRAVAGTAEFARARTSPASATQSSPPHRPGAIGSGPTASEWRM